MAVTNISTSLPDLILAPGSTITVTLDDASANITELNVYGYSPGKSAAVKLLPPLLTHEPLGASGTSI